MLAPIDIPNPLAPLQEGIGRLATILEALNPANWPTLLESGMTNSYSLLIDQLLADRSTIFDSEVFKSLTLFFASLALIPWVIGTLYHLTRAGDGEKGHGRLWLQETTWVMFLAPSLAVVTTFLQSTSAMFARYVIMQILRAETPKEALLRLVTIDGLSAFEKGLFVSTCYLLIMVIALELTATVLALPIGALAMIFTVALRWAGDTADAFYRGSIGAYVIGIGGPIGVALWFALVMVLTTPAYGDNPRARSLVGVVALFGAAAAIWPLRKQWNQHIKPRLHMPGRVDAEGGEMHSDSATVDTATAESADLSRLQADAVTVAASTPAMDMTHEARAAEEALDAMGPQPGNSDVTQPIPGNSDVTQPIPVAMPSQPSAVEDEPATPAQSQKEV